MFPEIRMSRLRRTEQLRNLTKETLITPNNLIYPIFVQEGINKPESIESMPGQFRLPLNQVVNECENIVSLGLPAIILFGIPSKKDDSGSFSYQPQGIVQRAIKEIKNNFGDKLTVISDICLCQYTNHGHCGIVRGNDVINDDTLQILQKIAESHASAGVDIVAPSGMIDGQVKSIRSELDQKGFTNVAILAYAAKQASCFYGPFKEAANSAPKFGDRKTYQLDYSNPNEALREVELDIKEGADLVMIKPALSYLDLIYRIKKRFKMPTVAYSVSGEYSMIKAMAERGWINEKNAVFEILTSIKRAGADIIITYYAKDFSKWLSEK